LIAGGESIHDDESILFGVYGAAVHMLQQVVELHESEMVASSALRNNVASRGASEWAADRVAMTAPTLRGWPRQGRMRRSGRSPHHPGTPGSPPEEATDDGLGKGGVGVAIGQIFGAGLEDFPSVEAELATKAGGARLSRLAQAQGEVGA
jgi:hypothetical protein